MPLGKYQSQVVARLVAQSRLAQEQAASAAGGGAQILFSTVITGSFVSVVPLIVSFLYLQRYWQTGLATGGVKG